MPTTWQAAANFAGTGRMGVTARQWWLTWPEPWAGAGSMSPRETQRHVVPVQLNGAGGLDTFRINDALARDYDPQTDRTPQSTMAFGHPWRASWTGVDRFLDFP